MWCDVWKVVEALFVNLKENKAKYPEARMEMPDLKQTQTGKTSVIAGGKSHFREQEPSINKSAKGSGIVFGKRYF